MEFVLEFGVRRFVTIWSSVVASECVVVHLSTDVEMSASLSHYILGWVHAILERLLH